MDLTGQVVLITGGSRGLGRAFAQALLAASARVAIIDILAAELHCHWTLKSVAKTIAKSMMR
jgi:NAD(P)-dependent dehydrogenase (short-subunit alcohol dehydrogenase family)